MSEQVIEAISAETQETLEQLSAALNARDRSRVAALLSPDCVFLPSAGTATRAEYHGPNQVTEGLFNFLERAASGKFQNVRRVFAGEEAFTEWKFVGTSPEGEPVEIHGCDYFKVQDRHIVVKSSFRKVP